MRYYKDGTITDKPTIPNVINPSQQAILDAGWFIYVDNPPQYDPMTEKLVRSGVIDGVVQYNMGIYNQELTNNNNILKINSI